MYKLPPVLILAGGQGTRLQSVVREIPKPLAEVAGKPFLQWHLEHLAQKGVSEIVISAGYLASCFEPFLASLKNLDLKVELVIEPEPLGTGGAVEYALTSCESFAVCDTFFCLNADSYTDWEPLALIEKMGTHSGALLALRVEDPSRYGTLTFKDNGELDAFEEKKTNPSSAYINAGVYLLRKSLFETMLNGKKSLEYDCFPRWLSEARTFGILKSSAPFIDIGTPESYRSAQTFFPFQK